MFDHTGELLEEYGKTLPAMATLRDSTMATMEKIVLYGLMSRCQPIREQGWTCWPSLTTIAMDAGISASTALLAVDTLVAAGIVSREPGGPQSSTTYVVDYAAILALPPNPKRERARRKMKRA